MKLSPSILRHLAKHRPEPSAAPLPTPIQADPTVYPPDYPAWAIPQRRMPWKPFGKTTYYIPVSGQDGDRSLSFVVILKEAGKPFAHTRHLLTIYAWPHGAKDLRAALLFASVVPQQLTPPFMFHNQPQAMRTISRMLETLANQLQSV